MRERIDVELSERFQEEVLLPEAIRDYEMNFAEIILLNKAYGLMLKEIGILDREECKRIVAALNRVQDTMKKEDIRGNCEDLYFNVEQAMIRETGIETGGKLHTGRSRNDLYSALSRMEVRKTSWEIVERLIELQKILIERAEENLDTVITGYTHMQPGQPITLGHYYSAACYALTRDFTRISNAYEHTNRSPYGAAAFAGATFPIDREYLCQLTGFDRMIENSIDCIAAKDYLVEMEMAYTILMNNISRFATDMYFWATDECGILDLGGEVAICSSIMPQKKNPVCFEYAKAKGAHTMGGMISALTVLKNVPYTNNTDIFETSTMYEESLIQTKQGLGIFTEAVRYSSIKRERAFAMAEENYSTVTGLADYLVVKFDFSFEEAHGITGKAVGSIADRNGTIHELTDRLLMETAREITGKRITITADEIKEVLDPWNNIENKKTAGSPNRKHVEQMLTELKDLVKNEEAWLYEKKNKVKAAYGRLTQECDLLWEDER